MAFTSIVTISQGRAPVCVRTSSTLHGVDTFDAVLGFDIVDISCKKFLCRFLLNKLRGNLDIYSCKTYEIVRAF